MPSTSSTSTIGSRCYYAISTICLCLAGLAIGTNAHAWSPVVEELLTLIEAKRAERPHLDAEFKPILAAYVADPSSDAATRMVIIELQQALGYVDPTTTPATTTPTPPDTSTTPPTYTPPDAPHPISPIPTERPSSITPGASSASVSWGPAPRPIDSRAQYHTLTINHLPHTNYVLHHQLSDRCDRVSVTDNISYDAYYPRSRDADTATFTYNLNTRYGNIRYGETRLDIACLRAGRADHIGTLTITIDKPPLTILHSSGTGSIYAAEQTFVDRINATRRTRGLHAYVRDTRLDATARVWSEISRRRGYMDHRRSPGDKYYNFRKIKSRFGAQGVAFKRVSGTYFVENIGRGKYSCTSTDCLTKAIRSTYNFFMSEASYNGVHYRSIIHPTYTHIGVGLVLDPTTKKYYLTIHYGNL